MDAAGVQPGADLPQERLETLRDLAEASVTRDLVEGRIRGVQAMTVAGIARRHIAKPQPPPEEPTPDQPAIDEHEAQIEAIYPGVDLSVAIAVLLAPTRLTLDQAEADTSVGGWLEVLDRLREHGSIEAAERWQHAQEHRRLQVQLERNRINSERAIASSRQAMLDGRRAPCSRPPKPSSGRPMPDITEKEFLRQVADLGRLFGWRTYHPWLSIHSERGWPDVAMVRPPRLVLAELKTDKGKATPSHADALSLEDASESPGRSHFGG